MQNQTITLPVDDANDMNAFIASPGDGGLYPGVMVFQEAFGVNRHIEKMTENIAARGYIAIAPELFHRTAPPGHTIPYTDFDSVRPHMAALTPEGLKADIQAAYGWLTKNHRVIKDKIGAIGFCLGGRVSFVANSMLPLAGAVSYYGGSLQTLTEKAKDLHGSQLFFWGGKDKHILPEHRDMVIKALDEAGKPYVNTVFSDADHGFNCDEKPSYHARASREAWAMTVAFFENNLAK